jgi:uncharacterized membrane protein YgcG
MALRFVSRIFLTLLTVIAVLSCHSARADEPSSKDDAVINIPRPDEHELVQDLAHLLSPRDEQQIKTITTRLAADKAVPIVVVTIESMKDHSPFKLRIETFANLLFDQWQIGAAEIDGQEWNRGILLLVSKGDRKARIELGAGWRREQDRQCQRIMQDQIVPHFKRNDYSGGILAGVKALDAMARQQAKANAAADPEKLPQDAPPAVVPPQNVPQHLIPPGAAPQANRPVPQFPPQFPRAWQHPVVQPRGATNWIAIIVLFVVGAIVVIAMSKAISSASGAPGTRPRRFRPRHVTGGDGSWWGGPFGWQNWAMYEMSRHNWQQDNSMPQHTTHHFSDSGMSHGGSIDTSSSSHSSFDGGSSGGGGATGSW